MPGLMMSLRNTHRSSFSWVQTSSGVPLAGDVVHRI